MTSIEKQFKRSKQSAVHRSIHGTRIFNSTGHRFDLRFAKQLDAILSALHSIDETRSVKQLRASLSPDVMIAMGSTRFEEFKTSKLGAIVLGVPFKSRMEANVARYFEALRTRRIETDFTIVNWVYEPCRFFFSGVDRGVTNYAPDFLVLYRGRPFEFVEVKGHFDKRSKTALKRFSEQYGHLAERLKLITATEYREIDRKFCRIIEGWES